MPGPLGINAASVDPPPNPVGYYHEGVYEYPPSGSWGGYALIYQAVPRLSPRDHHTLAEIWASTSDLRQAVEVGWTVDAGVDEGDATNPHLFVYHWVNGEQTCYNSCGWVQVGRDYPGERVWSTGTSPSYEIYQYQGNWWVGYNGGWMGYFPGSLWGGTFRESGLVQWYGEVSTREPGATPCSQMGNGVFPAQHGAAMTDLLYPASTYTPNVTPFQDAPESLYNVALINQDSFYYGGPGGGC